MRFVKWRAGAICRRGLGVSSLFEMGPIVGDRGQSAGLCGARLEVGVVIKMQG